MIIPLTLFIGTLGFLYYKSKEEVTLIDNDTLDSSLEEIEKDDLYKDLEDLFI